MAAKKEAKKSTEPKKKKGGGGVMGLVAKIMAALSVVSAAVLFAAAFDVGHMHLMETIKPFAIGPIVIFAIGALMHIFMGGGGKAAGDFDGETLATSLSDFQSKTASSLVAMQDRFDSMTGRDYESILEKNKELQAQLDEIHQAEREKVDGELEELRQKNVELEEQIKKWALEAVAKTVNGEAAEPMQAA